MDRSRRAEDTRAAWQLWHQDTFDREAPRRVEVAGRGLVRGLIELWSRHLAETVGPDGQRGFSQFNLWWERERRSVQIVGPWAGQRRLRRWVYGHESPTHEGRARRPDRGLLARVARTHAQLLRAGDTSERIVQLAERAASRQAFEQALPRLAAPTPPS